MSDTAGSATFDLVYVAPTVPPIAPTFEAKQHRVVRANRTLLLFFLVVNAAGIALSTVFEDSFAWVVAIYPLAMLAAFPIAKENLLDLFGSAYVRTPPPVFRSVGAGALTAVAAACIGKVLFTILGIDVSLIMSNLPAVETTLTETILIGLGLVVIGPLCEEIIFRGVLLRSYEGLLSQRAAWLSVSLLFLLIHVSVFQMLALVPLALIVTRLVQRNANLWSGFIMHATHNALVIYVLSRVALPNGWAAMLVSLALVGVAVTLVLRRLKVAQQIPSLRSVWSGSLVALVALCGLVAGLGLIGVIYYALMG